MTNRFELQDSRYEFPYHYIAHFDNHGLPRITRRLGWGFEYLTYMSVVKDEIRQLGAKSILDIGCGDGYLLNCLNDDTTTKVGVDISARPIAFAKAFATSARFVRKDIADVSERYDVVVLTEVLEHIRDEHVSAFVARAKDLVGQSGHLVITVPTIVVPRNKKHYRHYDETLLDDHFGEKGGWRLMRDYRVYRVSKRLTVLTKLINNRVWTINLTWFMRAFWKWHVRCNFYASRKDGAHLVRVYQRTQ